MPLLLASASHTPTMIRRSFVWVTVAATTSAYSVRTLGTRYRRTCPSWCTSKSTQVLPGTLYSMAALLVTTPRLRWRRAHPLLHIRRYPATACCRSADLTVRWIHASVPERRHSRPSILG